MKPSGIGVLERARMAGYRPNTSVMLYLDVDFSFTDDEQFNRGKFQPWLAIHPQMPVASLDLRALHDLSVDVLCLDPGSDRRLDAILARLVGCGARRVDVTRAYLDSEDDRFLTTAVMDGAYV